MGYMQRPCWKLIEAWDLFGVGRCGSVRILARHLVSGFDLSILATDLSILADADSDQPGRPTDP